jgi:hypothetical protein
MNANSRDQRCEALAPRLIGTFVRARKELARLTLQPVGGRRLSARDQLDRMALPPDHGSTGHGGYEDVVSAFFFETPR